MGNSQSSNGAALIIQYPNGRTERLYCRSVTAGEVMQMYPGHYVMQMNPGHCSDDPTVVSFTRVKLLRPHESLVLGSAYRLVTTQEVMKVMRAKKYGRMKNNNEREGIISRGAQREMEKQDVSVYVAEETTGQKQKSTKFGAARSKSWRPSLHSISEAGI